MIGLGFVKSMWHDEALQLERENRFRWQLGIIHGSGHNETKMAQAAKVLLTND